MKPPKIILKIDGKTRRFKAKKEVDVSIVLKSFELEEVLTRSSSAKEKLYACSSYICSVFGSAFTEEELQFTIPYTRIVPLTHQVMDYVISTAKLKVPSLKTKAEVVQFDQRKST